MKDNNMFSKGKVAATKMTQKPEMPSTNPQQYHELKQRLNHYDSNGKNMSIEELRNLSNDLKKVCMDKRQEMINVDKKYKMESFKNQKYKADVHEYDKKNESTRIILAKRLIDKFQGNDSPLFHNQNGLSPFHLLLLHYDRNDIHTQTICMICFQDIQLNSQIVQLPCHHILHRQCAFQNLLYAKHCPGCSKEIDFSKISIDKVQIK